MIQEISALDLHYLIDEFKLLIGGKVDKIFQMNKRVFYLRFFVSGHGNVVLKLEIPKLVYFTKRRLPSRLFPMGYCTFLRKYLNNAWVRDVKQHGFDRILEIIFEKNVYENDQVESKKFVMVLELFNPGNMILCKDDYTILSPLAGKDWSNRSIRKGLKYEFPPEMADVFSLTYDSFKELIKGSDKENIVKTLAMDLGLGGVYAEEVCFGIVDKKETKINEKDIKKLFESFSELINRKPKPVVYGNKKGFPFELKSFEGEFKECSSFSAVIDNLIIEKKAQFKNKFTDIIEKQTGNLDKIKVQIEENTIKGNTIYNNYIDINKLLDEVNKLRIAEGWDAVKEKYQDNKHIKELNSKDGKIVIDI